MPEPSLLRRRALLAGLPALSALAGCAAPLPPVSAASTSSDAQALLGRAAAAHGLTALAAISDVSVSYAGAWHALVNRLQPALVDAGFRGRSEERLLLHDPAGVLVAQHYAGPDGSKQVVRQMMRGAQGSVRVWFNDTPEQDGDKLAAAALVADGYSLFLLGPMLLAGPWMAERNLVMQVAAAEPVEQGGQHYDCDVLRVRLSPGLGLSESDELALFIDRDAGLMRKVRFTLNGLASTRGAIAEVDTLDHRTMQAVAWPTRFHERLLRPVPLPVHDWQMTGLDLNRFLSQTELAGPAFTGRAAASAAPLG